MPPNLKRRAEAAAHSSKSVKKPRARKSEQPEEGEPTPPSSSKEASRKVAASVDEGGENIEELPDQARKIPENVNGTVAGKPVQEKAKRARKTKEEKEAGLMPLAARTPRLRMFVGAHVSCAKGVQNAVTNSVHIGGNAFALFLKSQRKWENPPLQEEHRTQFHAFCKEHEYNAGEHVVPHGSYLVNLAQEDPTKAKQAYDAFLDDLKRCEALGIKLYNIHPGNTNGGPRAAAIGRIAEALNRAHQATTNVQPLLENMAGAGNVVGTTFEDLRDIIAGVADKSRIGVCLDTCHAFAAGYDLRTPAAFADTLDRFDRIVGLRYLRALHLNDSKAPLGSHRDLHQNIGLGFLGLRAFHSVMNQRGFEGLPMVLETPTEVPGPDGKVTEDRGVWAREIKLLESLIGMDAAGEEFQALERELAERGRPEREKHAEQFERKQEKDKRAAGKGKGAAQRKKKGEEGGESE